MGASTSAEWHGNDVDVATIEKQLSDLWGQVTRADPHMAAVRTSIFNLIVYTKNDEQAARICDNLNQLAKRRPSRAIVIVADRSSERSSVDAHAALECRDQSARGFPLCAEQVVVTAHGRTADHLASIVVPLLMPELPTYLYWPGQPPFGHRSLHRLLAVADQFIVDSAEFSSPGDGLANLARLCSGRQGVHDFHWSRLTPWRDVIAQFFDGPTWLPYAWSIRSIRVEFGAGGDAAPATAGLLLLLGWMASHLGWEPETTLDGLITQSTTVSGLAGERVIPIDIRFRESAPESAAGRVLGIEMVAQPKGEPPARFTVQRGEDLQHARICMEVHGGCEITRVVPLALKNDVELLTDELELAGHDRLYEIVVETASRVAGREVWVPA
jgi:glucose-6-phosphate dehydrogenase assembly protein OpcA